LELTGSELDPTDFVSTIPVYAPSRSSLSTLSTDFETTGLPTPKGTKVKFSSADGYAYFELDYVSNSKGGWPSFGSKSGTRRASIISDDKARSGDNEEDVGDDETEKPICSIDLDSCFGTDFFDVENDSPTSAQHTLKRIAFEQPHCGDCLIVKLLGDSGEKGLEAFLPERTESESSKVTERVAAVGVVGTKWMEIEYEREPIANQTRRDFVSFTCGFAFSLIDGHTHYAMRRLPGCLIDPEILVLDRRIPSCVPLNSLWRRTSQSSPRISLVQGRNPQAAIVHRSQRRHLHDSPSSAKRYRYKVTRLVREDLARTDGVGIDRLNGSLPMYNKISVAAQM
jgi:hypothetical protein